MKLRKKAVDWILTLVSAEMSWFMHTGIMQMYR